MGTISCFCGCSFSDGLVPSPHEWKLISEANLEQAINEIEELDWQAAFAGDKADWAIRDRALPVYKCPHCERMLIFENGLDKQAVSYLRE